MNISQQHWWTSYLVNEIPDVFHTVHSHEVTTTICTHLVTSKAIDRKLRMVFPQFPQTDPTASAVSRTARQKRKGILCSNIWDVDEENVQKQLSIGLEEITNGECVEVLLHSEAQPRAFETKTKPTNWILGRAQLHTVNRAQDRTQASRAARWRLYSELLSRSEIFCASLLLSCPHCLSFFSPFSSSCFLHRQKLICFSRVSGLTQPLRELVVSVLEMHHAAKCMQSVHLVKASV